jgi:hypothetical protein
MLSLACAGAVYAGFHREPVLLWPAGLFVAAAIGFSIRRLQAQLLARGAIWTCIVLFMLIAHLNDGERLPAVGVLLGGCFALLVAARAPLSSAQTAFQPVAFRGTLLLSMVLALADTLALLFWGFVFLVSPYDEHAIPLFICAGVMLVSVVGLYRLRTWGLALGIFTNLAIAILFWTQIIDVHELKLVFVACAVLQLLLPLPMLIGILRGRPLQGPSFLRKLSPALLPTALIAVMALAVQPLFGKSVLITIGTWLLY